MNPRDGDTSTNVCFSQVQARMVQCSQVCGGIVGVFFEGSGAELNKPVGLFLLKIFYDSPIQASQQGKVTQGSESLNPQDALEPKED